MIKIYWYKSLHCLQQFITRNLDQSHLLCIAREVKYAGNKTELLTDSLVQNAILANQEKVQRALGNVRGHVVILTANQVRVWVKLISSTD